MTFRVRAHVELFLHVMVLSFVHVNGRERMLYAFLLLLLRTANVEAKRRCSLRTTAADVDVDLKAPRHIDEI